MAQIDTDRRDGRRRQAQAIILAGFILAVGIAGTVLILNNTIQSINIQGGSSGDVSADPINYRDSMETESRKALQIVNELATQGALDWREANETYVNYTEDLNFRIQKVLGSNAAVDIQNLTVRSSFNNSWRMRKNESTTFQQVVRRPVEVVYAIDSSGSMGSNDPDGDRYGAARNMTANLSRLDRTAVVDWDHDAGFRNGGIVMRFQNGSGAGQEELNQTVNRLKASPDSADGSTYMGGGIREAVDLFREDGKSTHDNVVVLLSDGENQNGWLHFPRHYAESDVDTDDDGCGNGMAEVHEWGFVASEICASDAEVGEDSGFYTETYQGTGSTLDDRTMHQATKDSNQSVTIYTVLLEGSGDVNKPLMRNVANGTGGQFFQTTNADELNDIFQQIADAISDPTSLADNVSRYDRFQVTVDEFNAARNLTIKMRDESDDLLWQMNVSNRSGRKVVSVRDNTSTLNVHNWTDPGIGGPPLEIDVLADTINGANRNLSKNAFLGVNNTSVIFDEGQGVNGTYDIWTDTGADVKGQCGPPVPCASSTNQTVGAMRGANFTVSYRSDDVTYTDEINVSIVDTQNASGPGAGGIGGPSPPSSPSDPSGRLEFDPPYHDRQTYWTFDQNVTDAWPDDHAFDASDQNHTAGLEPDRPESMDRDGMDHRAFNFSTDDDVVDQDGWNDIPLDGPFTVTFWFNPASLTGYGGTLFDATKDGGPHFEVAVRDNGPTNEDDFIWEYEDESGNTVNLSRGFGSLLGTDLSGIWFQGAVVGGWNQSVHGVFVRTPGNSWESSATITSFDGKPMQRPIDTDSFGAMGVGAPVVDNSFHGGFPDEGFNGRIDDVRIYHERLANASFDIDSKFSDHFNKSNPNPANWSTSNSAEKNNETWDEEWRSVRTCCEADSTVTLKNSEGIDLSSASTAEFSTWIKAGGPASGTDSPDGGSCGIWSCNPSDDLRIEYTDAFGTWNTLRTLDGGSAAADEVFEISENLPADAFHSDLRFRFRQTDGDGVGEDHWHIDNVRVVTKSSPTVDVGGLNQVFNDVENTPNPPSLALTGNERDRFFVTEYKTFDSDVDVENLELQNVKATNGSGDLRVRVESNVTTGLQPERPENVSAWIPVNASQERYTVDPEPAPFGTNDVNLTVPNDELRLRVEADAPDTNDSPRLLEADLAAP